MKFEMVLVDGNIELISEEFKIVTIKVPYSADEYYVLEKDGNDNWKDLYSDSFCDLNDVYEYITKVQLS